MTRFRAFFLIMGLALLVQPAARGDDVRFADIRNRLQSFVDRQDISGAVTVVGNKDGILSLEAVGKQNLEEQQPMAKDALFRIASMTKPITAIGIMMLVDEKKLKLDDPVEKILPEFRGQMLVAERNQDTVTLKKPPRPITVRDLLTHTSGLPGNGGPGMADLYQKRNRTLAEGVIAFSQRPLEFAPGERWSYCNAGIDTLGRIIEVLSGQSYEDFLKERIFVPLGMVDTTFYPSPEQLQRLARMYSKQGDKLAPAAGGILGPPKGSRYPIPAGGLYSTGPDLAKLYQLMLHKGTKGNIRFLSEASVEEMTKVQTGDKQAGFTTGMGWGLGWGVVKKPAAVTATLSPGTFGHGGAFGTQAWIDPVKGVYMVLLIQRSDIGNSDASPMRQALHEAAMAAVAK